MGNFGSCRSTCVDEEIIMLSIDFVLLSKSHTNHYLSAISFIISLKM